MSCATPKWNFAHLFYATPRTRSGPSSKRPTKHFDSSMMASKNPPTKFNKQFGYKYGRFWFRQVFLSFASYSTPSLDEIEASSLSLCGSQHDSPSSLCTPVTPFKQKKKKSNHNRNRRHANWKEAAVMQRNVRWFSEFYFAARLLFEESYFVQEALETFGNGRSTVFRSNYFNSQTLEYYQHAQLCCCFLTLLIFASLWFA